MTSEYIEQRNGGYYVAGTRISLDSVVYSSNRGNSPERILEQFPLLSKLSRIYGAIAFYLDHKVEIDKYLEEGRREFESDGVPLSESNPALWDRLQQARIQMSRSKTGESRSWSVFKLMLTWTMT